ncbi:hypothetical protein TNCV_918891 [Trichonephila clavipes]|nr:hypothetical protein TNCV_918891 [Trichonephila clavipes]
MYRVFAAWSTLNSRQATSPLVRLVEEKERWEAPGHPQGFLLKIMVEPNQIILSPAWCSKLTLTTGIKIWPLGRDGPRSDIVRQVALETAIA